MTVFYCLHKIRENGETPNHIVLENPVVEELSFHELLSEELTGLQQADGGTEFAGKGGGGASRTVLIRVAPLQRASHSRCFSRSRIISRAAEPLPC